VAIVPWPRRTPALPVPATKPRWQRLRRGGGLARLRTRGEVARPAVLLVACVVPAVVLWQEGGRPLAALFAGTVPRATQAVTTLVAAWTPGQLDLGQGSAARPQPSDGSSAAPSVQDASAQAATGAAASAGPAAASGDASLPPPDSYVAVLGSTDIAGPAADNQSSAERAGAAHAPVLQTTVMDTAASAPVTAPATLAQAGTTLARGATLPRPATHVVATGESLSTIATRYGVTVDDLVRVNGLPDRDKIAAGDVLTLPR
jgi:LysM repeat protein